MDYVAVLKQYFGFDGFRGIQQDIIESIGAGHDTLGLMPTGGGKSITFQVPALTMKGVCIVVTPLIALMKDQVEHLRARGILAAAVYSGMNMQEIIQTLDNALYGGVKFLYVSPERLNTPLFINKVRYMDVCFITVDEAHCISQWGYDFRPAYLGISKIRELLPGVPVLALTATATPEVVKDIQHQLGFQEPRVFRMSFRRENLSYVVRHVDDKFAQLVHILNSVPGCAIVYTRSRQGTRDVAKSLSDNGISATYYHAGLDFAVKDQRQKDWQQNKVRVMVATNAFGMGIDKPDVRLVIHLDCPDSLEAYFQEAGRAGRDGKKSWAVLLFRRGDARNLRTHILESFPEKDYIRRVYDELAYFFQLGLEDGEGAKYEFDVNRFCIVFRHYPARLYGAMSILQRAGYITFDLDPDTHPRCKFLVDRDSLYRIQGLSQLDDNVMVGLLRLYTGLFTDLRYIEELELAKFINLPVDQVRQSLKSLSHRGIIKYIPRRNVPVVRYPQQRIKSEKLIFTKAVYDDLFERMKSRVESVIYYAEQDEKCRSLVLLEYFGEKNAAPCNVCDICLQTVSHGSSEKEESLEASAKRLSDLIREAGGIMPIAKMSMLPIPKEQMEDAINFLRDHEMLIIEGASVKLVGEMK